jgi:hypothetical protein
MLIYDPVYHHSTKYKRKTDANKMIDETVFLFSKEDNFEAQLMKSVNEGVRYLF